LRLAACPADCLRLAEHWKFPAVGFAVRSMKAKRPAEELQTEDIRDNYPNVTTFLSTKHI
jgi:hypothetical protein